MLGCRLDQELCAWPTQCSADDKGRIGQIELNLPSMILTELGSRH